MNHKDYEDLIRQSDMLEEEELLADRFVEEYEDVEIPESLKPENIEALLKSKKNKKKNRFTKFASLAASAAVVLGVTAYGMLNLGWLAPSADSAADTARSQVSEGMAAEESLETADSYQEIYDCIQAYAKEFNDKQSARNGNIFDIIFSAGMKSDSAEMESVTEDSLATGTNTDGGSGGYSDTNTREEGVGEADVVKTDGEYIYILDDKKIQIIDIRKPQMAAIGEISLKGEVYPREMFIHGDKLVLFYDETVHKEVDSDEYGAGYYNYAAAETFDIKDRANPKSIGKISQSGYYDSVRISDGYYYMFSRFYADWSGLLEDKLLYVPMVQGELIESDHVYLPKLGKGDQFTVISSFSLDDPDEAVDGKAVLSRGGQLYVSGSSIYVYENIYDEKEDYNQTSIRKIAYKDGELTGVAQAKIWGYINDSFSIDEYKGNLRVVTTVDPIIIYERDGIFLNETPTGNVNGTRSNALYVLNEKLEVTGKIERLAPDEQVYSARLMGDTGYFVTFRQVDPLFSVDLSDPTNPKVIGELKIPGFSEYLHPYGDGMLLGIGMNADESGFTDGVKISMFDISDPANVSEVDKTVLDNVYSTEVAYNYKGVLADPQKNVIGFVAYGEDMHYLVYSYDKDNGFTCLLDREISGWGYNIRGLYADNVLYLVEGKAIESFDMHTYKKIDDIVL